MTPAQVNGRILLAMGIVVVAARLAGWAISKIGQPRVHGEILAGILLGPSLLGLVWASGMDYAFPPDVVDGLKVIAQLGLVLFMFLIGLELDLGHLRGQGHRAVVISHASIIVPIVLGAVLGLWLYPRLGGDANRTGFVLFMGAAMAITAFPVLARVLQETGLTHTRIGVLTITCAAVDDVTAWCVLAVVVAIVKASGIADAFVVIGWSLVYVGVMLTVVRRLLRRIGLVPAWAIVAVALLSAWTTEVIGIHAIFGAFMAGAVMPRNEATRNLARGLEMPTLTFLLPVFFVVVGLATRVDLLDDWYLWGITALITLTAIAGKWGGAMLAARAVGESWSDAATIGILMNTRGLTELVILTVGLELGVIGPTVFTAMVLMALITTLMATPLLSVVSPRSGAPTVGSRVSPTSR
ncbi:MAG: transporter, family [Ilumatobacteraceae bacterium]|nr:transporter, family [Ilumatobacteraceae bacterium]